MACDCCALFIAYPGLTKKTYSMGCDWCAARYIAHGGKDDIAERWVRYGVNERRATQLRLAGEFVDPELKRK